MTPLVLLSLFGISMLMPMISNDDSDDIADLPDENDEAPVIEPITPEAPTTETPVEVAPTVEAPEIEEVETPASETPVAEPVAPEAPEPLNGTTADDTLATNTAQTVNGYSGGDTLTAQEGADGATLNGGRDSDTFNLASNNVLANGERGDDTFNVLGRNTEANGNSGDDTFVIGDPEITGQAGHFSTLSGGAGDDSFTALSNPQFLEINGGDDNDTITANGDGIALRGDLGNDTIVYGGDTESFADGGAGDDLLIASDLDRGVAGQMRGGDGNDTLTVGAEGLILNGPLELRGDAGDDVLQNSTGSDAVTLWGGEGADRLTTVFEVNDNGEGGIIRGGTGADTFNVEMAIGETTADSIDSSNTVIRDFTKGEDVLNLVIDAPAGAEYTFGDIAIIEDETGGPLGAVSQIRVTFTSTTDGEQPIESIIRLEGIAELTLDDFILTMR